MVRGHHVPGKELKENSKSAILCMFSEFSHTTPGKSLHVESENLPHSTNLFSPISH